MDEQQAVTYSDRQVLAREIFTRTLPHIASIEIQRRGDGQYWVGLTHNDSKEFPSYTSIGSCERDWVQEMVEQFLARDEIVPAPRIAQTPVEIVRANVVQDDDAEVER